MRGIPDGELASDDRAVAPVLGIVLLFGIAAVGLSIWQTAVIPEQNAQVEFNHYTEIQEDMQELRQAHQETVSTAEPQSPSLQLGTTYNSRIIGVNPPNPQGSLRSEELGDFELQDAPLGTSDTMVTTQDVCGVSQPHTDEIRYGPAYNRLSDEDTPPIIYENTVLYRETPGGELLLESDQALIRGSTINILPVQSEVARSDRSTTMTLASEGFEVEKTLESDATPTLVVPTEIPADVWEDDLLEPQIDEGYVNGVTDVSGGVRIDLAETPGQFPWTVRCAITTDGDTTAVPNDVATPPEILNGGVGHGGTTEHTVDSNQDELVIPNGQWIDVASISEILVGPSDTTGVPNQGGFNGGEGMGLEFKVEGEDTDEPVYVQLEVTGQPGNWQAKKVKMGNDPNNYQGKSLTSEAAQEILGPGQADILDVDSYKTSSFQTQDGNFGSFIERLETMENVTVQTTQLHGRVDMKIRSGELSLGIDADDRAQTYVYNNTSTIEFDVTAEGVTDEPQNVDLHVRDSQGQQLDSTSPRVDRETLTGLNGGTETFTLTWEPEWGSLSSGTEYEILVEGQDDQAFGTVDVIQSGNVYLELDITDVDSSVEYRENVTTDIEVENVGEKDASGAQIQLSLAGQSGPQETVDLDAGETTTLTMEYNTTNINAGNTGAHLLNATWNNEKDSETVVVEQPEIILDPRAENVTAGDAGLSHRFAFTLGEDLQSGAQINVDLTDTGPSVVHDGNSGNWTVVDGSGQISLNTNNNRVTSVKYQTGSDAHAGDRIVFEGDYTNAKAADAGVLYDLEFRVTSSNLYAGGQKGDTNHTTFESRETIVDPTAGNVTAGAEGETQTFGFGLDSGFREGDRIAIDLSDTGDAVEYDGGDAWTVVSGGGSVTTDLGDEQVIYTVGSGGEVVELRASGVDAEAAEPGASYDVGYRIDSAEHFADQERDVFRQQRRANTTYATFQGT